MRKLLAVRLSGGLCNRLRVLLSAIGYCETTNRNLVIYWERENYFAVPLGCLFSHPLWEIGPLTNLVLLKFAHHTGKQYGHDQVHRGLRDWFMYVDTCHTFSCAHQFSAPLIAYLSRLTPVAPIRQSVIECYATYFAGKKVVGVSVRHKKAHHKTLEHSPPRWFVKRINEIHEMDKSVQFFLSADCKEVSEEIRSNTNATIIELPKTYTFNTLDGVRESICDLYLLARTNYIIGGYWSSFSDMCFWMRGERAFETSQDSSNASLLPYFLRHELALSQWEQYASSWAPPSQVKMENA